MKTLADLTLHLLRDMHNAERQFRKLAPQLRKAAQDDELTSYIENAAEISEDNAARVDEAFAVFGQKPEGEKCQAMKGLVDEAEAFVEEAEGDVRDAGLIATLQAILHYQIARYGTLRAYAEELEEADAVELFEACLEEVATLDDELTELAELRLNREAVEEGLDDEDPVADDEAIGPAGDASEKDDGAMERGDGLDGDGPKPAGGRGPRVGRTKQA